MDSSTEFNRTDENSSLIDHRTIYKSKIKDDLYDVQDTIDDSNNSKYERTIKPVMNNDDLGQIHNLITDNGDAIYYSKNIYENSHSSIKSQIIVRQSFDSVLEFDQLEDDGLVEPNSTPEDSIAQNQYEQFNFDTYANYNEENEQNSTIKSHHHHLKTKYSFITEHPLTHVDSQHAILIERKLSLISNKEKHNDNDQFQSILSDNELRKMENIDEEQNIILPETTDLKDLNPYESSSSSSLTHCKSQEKEYNVINTTEYSNEDNQSIK